MLLILELIWFTFISYNHNATNLQALQLICRLICFQFEFLSLWKIFWITRAVLRRCCLAGCYIYCHNTPASSAVAQPLVEQAKPSIATDLKRLQKSATGGCLRELPLIRGREVSIWAVIGQGFWASGRSFGGYPFPTDFHPPGGGFPPPGSEFLPPGPEARTPSLTLIR